VSDGFHTFDELYEHRCALFLALMASNPEISWIAPCHHDNTKLEGWFVAGMNLPTGDVTYHLPNRLWFLACTASVITVPVAPPWDGHAGVDVVERLLAYVKRKGEG
jgi:hypothetical protein